MNRVTLLALAATLLLSCSEAPPPVLTRTAAPPLDTVAVQSARVARETLFDAVIEAVNQATVAAQTSGRVVELPFDVGDYVEQGAVIVRLTSSEQSARVEAAEGTAAEARARLAEAQLAYDRTKDIYDRQLIARAQLDKAVADLNTARARAEAGQAALAEAREGLNYTVVRAPYPGTVVARHVQVGETVAPGSPLMTGVSLTQLRAVVEIPQLHVGPLRTHRRARVILPGERSLAGEALRIPPNADPVTHTFRVLVTLPAGDHAIFPGSLVKVAIVTGEEQRLLVPAAAVVRRGELTGLYVVDGAGGVSLRYVRFGTAAEDGRVPVLAGVAEGERVATDPIAAAIAYKRQFGAAGEA